MKLISYSGLFNNISMTIPRRGIETECSLWNSCTKPDTVFDLGNGIDSWFLQATNERCTTLYWIPLNLHYLFEFQLWFDVSWSFSAHLTEMKSHMWNIFYFQWPFPSFSSLVTLGLYKHVDMIEEWECNPIILIFSTFFQFYQ